MSDTPSHPLVSIITPSFNQAQYLGDALHSVACQTYPRIEHIVMDGGSSDGSVELLKTAGDSVTWRSEPDKGQCDAINKAFALTQGEIIGWVNSDDAYFDCSVVQQVVDAFEADPSVDVFYGHAVRAAADGRIVYILWTPAFKYRRMELLNFLVQPAVFIRRSALGDHIVDEAFDFTMDWELWLRLGRDHKFKRLDSVLAVDRHQPGRKNRTAIDVFHENERALRKAYGLAEPPAWFWKLYQRFWWLRRRYMGGLLVGRVTRAKLAFKGYVEDEGTLFRRQVLLRTSKWAPEDREAF
jgi:glycosyltransferase involved in cell wall biosynthesis